MAARVILLLALVVFSFADNGAMAASDPPRPLLLSSCSKVVLAKVASVQGGKIAFSIIEVWKGKSPAPLILSPIVMELKIGDECLLCGTGQSSINGTVAETAMFGGTDWACLPIKVDDGKATVEGVGSLEKAKATCLAKTP